MGNLDVAGLYIVVPSKNILYTKKAYCNYGTNTVIL
jgi:hypothetical protein